MDKAATKLRGSRPLEALATKHRQRKPNAGETRSRRSWRRKPPDSILKYAASVQKPLNSLCGLWLQLARKGANDDRLHAEIMAMPANGTGAAVKKREDTVEGGRRQRCVLLTLLAPLAAIFVRKIAPQMWQGYFLL